MIRQIDIHERIVAHLSQVRATEPAEIWQQIANGQGDAELDSQEAMTVIAMLESELGRELPGPEDLEPEEYCTIGALNRLVERKLRGNP